jgi:hypothetical protein
VKSGGRTSGHKVTAVLVSTSGKPESEVIKIVAKDGERGNPLLGVKNMKRREVSATKVK